MSHVTLASEYANSKLVDVVTVADEDRVSNNLLQNSKLWFGKKMTGSPGQTPAANLG